MAEYQLTPDETQIIHHLPNGNTRYIPVDPDNWAYQEFLEWDAIEGNDPDPADPLPPPDPNEAIDRDVLANLRPVYQTMLDGLNDIQATRSSLIAHANVLSSITVGGTLAQTQNQLQSVLRSMGTDLGTMIDNTDKLARGSETMLKTLASLVRNLGRG